MRPYTVNEPIFSRSVTIPEPTDTDHADNINSAPKQLLQNTLANREDILAAQGRLADVEGTAASAYSQANAAANAAAGINARLNAGALLLGGASNASGNAPVAVGASARATGRAPVAVGALANASEDEATAVGVNTSASGSYATAIGSGAWAVESSSVALGANAVAGRSYGTALGAGANAANISSTAVGTAAQASSSYSIAIGRANASGSYSIAIGLNANASQGSSVALGEEAGAFGAYAVALGSGAHTSNSSSIQLGSPNSLSSITAKVGVTVTSDERDKADMEVVPDGAVDFLKKVRAVTYVFNGRGMYIDDEGLSEEDKGKKRKYGLCAYDKEAHAAGTKKGKRRRVGVSAQEVQRALEETFGTASYANLVNDNLFDFDPSEIPEDVESQLAVNYEGFIPFLIKAVQELDGRIGILEKGGDE